MSFPSQTSTEQILNLLLKSKKVLNDSLADSTISTTCKDTLISLKSLNEETLNHLTNPNSTIKNKKEENLLETLSLGSFDAILTEIDNESKDNSINTLNHDQQTVSTFSTLPQNVRQFILTPV